MALRVADPLPPDARLTLLTLGAAECVYLANGQRVRESGLSGKTLALLVYLACINGRAGREHLSDLLWSDLEPDSARHALRQTVWYLRKRLGEEITTATASDIGLAHPVASDRDAFLTALTHQDLEAAVAAYTGDFLPNFAVAGGGEFEQWADLERRQLRTAFLRTADKLTRRHLSTGRFSEAVSLARRIRDTDRDAEAGWRLLIEALVASRDTLAATIEADALDAMLRDEEREPEPATRASLRIARQAPASEHDIAPRRALVADTVGREREFAMLLGAWEQAKAGRGRQVHVSAPAGLGKTRLLGDVHTRFIASRARAVALRANPGERSIPYALAAELAVLLAPLPGARAISPASAAALLAISPALSSWFGSSPDTSTGDDALRRRTVAMAELVSAVSAEQPLAISIDDLHWADVPSRQVIAGLAGRLDAHRVLLVTAARPIADHGAEGTQSEVLALRPLAASDLNELLTRVAPLPDTSWADQLAADLEAATGGSPLLVVETLHLLLERDALRLDADGWSLHSEQRLRELLGAESAITRRLEQLSRPESWQLLLLATAGAPLATSALAKLAAVAEPEAAEILGLLEQRGFVASSGGVWLCAHDEIADHMVAVAGADAGRAAHAALGQLLSTATPTTLESLGRSLRHMMAAGERDRLRSPFQRAWSLARRQDASITPEALARLLLADHVSVERIGWLTRSIPWSERPWAIHGTRAVAAAALLMLAASTLVFALRRPVTSPEDVLHIAVLAPGGDRLDVHELAISPQFFSDTRSIATKELESTTLRGASAIYDAGEPSPDGRMRIISKNLGDSGGIDLVAETVDGVSRRLTDTPGDDGIGEFHPSGSYFIFPSARWDRTFDAMHVAALDVRTGRVRQLTYGAHSDIMPSPSPDGSRVAFVRMSRTSEPNQVCIVSFDGRDERCRALREGAYYANPRWVSATRFVVASQAEQDARMWQVEVPSLDATSIGLGDIATLTSPDGRYAAEITDTGVLVFPWERRAAARVFRMRRGDPTPVVRWSMLRQRPVARVVIEPPVTSLAAGGTYALRAVALDDSAQAVDVHGMRWTVLSGPGRIDDDGLLHTPSPGTVVVRADLGGWRADSLSLQVVASEVRTIVNERWSHWPDSNWVPYGSPRPQVITGPGGVTAFWNGGDKSFSSGAHWRVPLSVDAGLGVEADVSVPINSVLWQFLNLGFFQESVAGRLAHWDHIGDDPPLTMSCVGNAPSGEGVTATHIVDVQRFAKSLSVVWNRDITSPAWHRLRVQLFPDGRCGVAIDGRAVLLLPPVAGARVPNYLVVQGKSVGTKVLVGPLVAWSGVKQDVDWSVLERTMRVQHAGAAVK